MNMADNESNIKSFILGAGAVLAGVVMTRALDCLNAQSFRNALYVAQEAKAYFDGPPAVTQRQGVPEEDEALPPSLRHESSEGVAPLDRAAPPQPPPAATPRRIPTQAIPVDLDDPSFALYEEMQEQMAQGQGLINQDWSEV
jgi:hypothetical protein